MKKIVLFIVAFIGIIVTTGFAIHETATPKGYPQEECLQEPREIIGQMFVKHEKIKGIDTYYLMIINKTGKGMCLHFTIKGHEIYGYVPEWANTRESAVYVFFSHEEFRKEDFIYIKDHSEDICLKCETSQF